MRWVIRQSGRGSPKGRWWLSSSVRLHADGRREVRYHWSLGRRPPRYIPSFESKEAADRWLVAQVLAGTILAQWEMKVVADETYEVEGPH